MLLQVSISSGQQAALSGKVTDANGKPLAGVDVQGSSGKCCPVKKDSAKTDPMGDFHLDRAGQVIRVWKEGFTSQTLVVKPGVYEMQILLHVSNDLDVPECRKPRHGYRQIGHRVMFAVPKHGTKILGGKWDVDYVRYLIKPRGSASNLELSFGPYAISMTPDDEQFANSSDFVQRDLAIAGFGLAGQDSSGRFANGNRWRYFAFGGMGGAIYKDALPKEAALFDQIIDSACFISFDGIPH
ncbi:MAG: carboxypeptidase-like regulatory domain-containing protein [Terriglobales bacterium]